MSTLPFPAALLAAAPPAPWQRVAVIGDVAWPNVEPYVLAGAQVIGLGLVFAPEQHGAPRTAFHFLGAYDSQVLLAEQGVRPESIDVLVTGASARVTEELRNVLAPGGVWAHADGALTHRPGRAYVTSSDAPIDRNTCVDRLRVARLLLEPLGVGSPRFGAGDQRRCFPTGDGGVLAVFAHPDDESVYAGGTLAAMARSNAPRSDAPIQPGGLGPSGNRMEAPRPHLLDGVHVLSLTNGAGGRSHLATEDLARVRQSELAQAAEILGLRSATCLDLPDFGKYADACRSVPLTASDTLTVWGRDRTVEQIVRAIRMHRPRTLLSFDPTRDPNYSLHGHHLATGLACVLAFEAAASATAFPEHSAMGLAPHAITDHWVIVPEGAGSQVRIAIDATVKRRALAAHASQAHSMAALDRALAASDPCALYECWHHLQGVVGR